LKQLHGLGNVVSYLDAAHGGWLGWDNNLQKVIPIFQEVLNNAGGASVIRGFATNTANYQPLGSSTSTSDPCNLKSQYNFAIDEIHFINLLDAKFSQYGMSDFHYITDTSRNGVTNERGDCSNWCNIKGSGLGERPTTDVSHLGAPKLDALVWIKTPGESDGTTDTSGRYDPKCTSSDSASGAPEAGQWFESFFVDLVNNAVPPVTCD
jgi:cellulose 1,4-beta-cellobiosidase